MAVKLTLKISGIPEFERKAKEAVKAVNSEAMQDRILPAAKIMRDIAKSLVRRSGKPRDPKFQALQDAIFATKGRKPKGVTASLASAISGDRGISVIAGVDRKKAPHAHLVEFGHGGKSPAPARPYMRPAASAARPAVITIIQSAVREILRPFSR